MAWTKAKTGLAAAACIVLIGVPAALVAPKVIDFVALHHGHGARKQAAALPTDTPLAASLAFVDSITQGRRVEFDELVRFPDGLAESQAAALRDGLFRRWTAQYGRWKFGAVRENRPPDNEGTRRLELRYRDPDTGREDGLLIFLRKYPAGWRVYVKDVPAGTPSATAATNP